MSGATTTKAMRSVMTMNDATKSENSAGNAAAVQQCVSEGVEGTQDRGEAAGRQSGRVQGGEARRAKKRLPAWFVMLTEEERVYLLCKQASVAAKPPSKYGWAKEKVRRFLTLEEDDGAAMRQCRLTCPDIYGRSQKQVYWVLWKAIKTWYEDEPVAVRIYDYDDEAVYLERTDDFVL